MSPLKTGTKRGRPDGRPVMHQHWGKLLFLHWAMDAAALEQHLPEGVEIDLFDDVAWIGVVPFTMWGIRASFLPPVPGLSSFHELNVRTYVRVDGVPGVWFFSLDASNPVAVHAARLAYHLPYYSADIDLRQEGQTIHYRSVRTHRNAPAAGFEASWTALEPTGDACRGTLEHFLTERYCLYTDHRGRILRGRVDHPPWPLRRARLERLESTMVEALGLPSPAGEPLLLHADELAVRVWPLESRAAATGWRLADDVSGSAPVIAPQGRIAALLEP